MPPSAVTISDNPATPAAPGLPARLLQRLTARLRWLADRLLKGSALHEHLASLLQRRTSYSQFGEDMLLRAYYDRLQDRYGIRVTGGWIVDVGAYRPMVWSNTYGFARRGWRCLNIDPAPGTRRAFARVRPRDITVETGIADAAGSADFYQFGTPSPYNTFDADTAQQVSTSRQLRYAVHRVPLTRLDQLLDTHQVGDDFEMLLIDAEGLDLQVLHTCDFTRHRPRLVMIEVHDVDAFTLGSHRVTQFLAGHGYQVYAWNNPNIVYVRADCAV